MERLEDKIKWYDSRSIKDQRYFKVMKIVVILAAALIPFLSGKPFPYSQWIIGGLGVLITILEGLQQLYQHQANWINYRSTVKLSSMRSFSSSLRPDPTRRPRIRVRVCSWPKELNPSCRKSTQNGLPGRNTPSR
jgi:Protein of unknown function (DUF4231)